MFKHMAVPQVCSSRQGSLRKALLRVTMQKAVTHVAQCSHTGDFIQQKLLMLGCQSTTASILREILV